MSRRLATAAKLGLAACHLCGLVSKVGRLEGNSLCPRCGAHLHLRKPNSIARTWALVIAAYILYIPANVLPIMQSGSLFGAQADTIMSGVVYLWTSGDPPLAALIFFASIFVPLAKLLSLSFLALSAQRHSAWHPRQRTRLYRMVEYIGPWSMLDIYVLALLVTLVHFEALASITPGPGAIAFASVVVLTLLAAISFDPRLLWDPVTAEKPEHD
jgi:paraquat-inducible protein A